MTTRIAAVMTCHNRRTLTLPCLASLRQQVAQDTTLDAFVVDDGSTDGTSEAVRSAFPETTLVEGDGQLFWNGGMHVALSEAFRGDYDYYLWLNDDAALDTDAVARLLATEAELLARGEPPPIIVGATRDPDSGAVSYGGRYRPSRIKRTAFHTVGPGRSPKPVETMHGNIVLVPRAVARRVGNIDPAFRHWFGDEDYGLRARAAGFGVWLAPGTLGTCEANPAPVFGHPDKPVRQEFRALWGVKAFYPPAWATFTRRWAGPLWFLFFLSAYLKRGARIVAAHLPLRRGSPARAEGTSHASRDAAPEDGDGDGVAGTPAARLQVLALLYELRPSGAEVVLRVTASEWQRHGIDMHLLAVGPTVGPYADVLAERGYPIHHIPLLPALPFARRYLRLLRAGRFNTVNVHVETGNVLTCGLPRLLGRTVVRTLHSVWPFTGFLRVERLLQRAGLRLAGVRNVSVGPAVAEFERRHFLNPSSVIVNCVDVDRFSIPDAGERQQHRHELGIADDVFAIVSVGNCHPYKNHSALLEALPRVLDEAPATYLHVGQEEPGSPERRLADELGISARVRFLGSVDDVYPVLAAADCFVMPSRREGLSIAALEALAAGTPAVLSNVEGLRSISDCVPGIRYVRPDAEGLAEGILSVFALDPDERTALTAATAEAVHDVYSPEKYVREHARAFR